MEQKRSSGRESAQLDLFETCTNMGHGLCQCTNMVPSLCPIRKSTDRVVECTALVRVGGRQEAGASAPQGGGYPDICNVLEFQKKRPRQKNGAARDVRLDELRKMGLQRVWLDVAEAIGADAFLAMWRIIDADPATQHNDTSLRLSLRVYRSYLRFQRNRYIEALATQGVPPLEIKRRLERQLCETVSLRHITRIAATAKL